MANERNGYQPLPVKGALEALSRARTAQIPGLEVPKNQVTGGPQAERLLLVANKIGAHLLTGDPTIESLRLTQVEVGGAVDTVLDIRRGAGKNTELVLSGGRVSVINEVPGRSYNEFPAGQQDEALTRRVLTSLAAL